MEYAICETCHRIVYTADVDAAGNCVVCQPPSDRPTEDEWADLGRPIEPEEKQ